MARDLVLPAYFADYAWEAEAKGVFWDAAVEIDGVSVAVTFYDPTRLLQDVEAEFATHPWVALQRVLVVQCVTEANMRTAVAEAPDEFFAVASGGVSPA